MPKRHVGSHRFISGQSVNGAPFYWKDDSIPFLSCSKWEDLPHGFYGIEAGLYNENYKSALEHIAKSRGLSRIFDLEQVHSADLVDLRDRLALSNFVELQSAPSAIRPKADGFLLSRSTRVGFGFAVKSADCVPILLRDSENIAIIHAGWRGLANGVLERALEALKGPIDAIIGPSAHSCCYEVGQEVIEALGANGVYSLGTAMGKYMLSTSMSAAKILSNRCSTLNLEICTICNPKFFSLRRSGRVEGKNIALVCL